MPAKRKSYVLTESPELWVPDSGYHTQTVWLNLGQSLFSLFVGDPQILTHICLLLRQLWNEPQVTKSQVLSFLHGVKVTFLGPQSPLPLIYSEVVLVHAALTICLQQTDQPNFIAFVLQTLRKTLAHLQIYRAYHHSTVGLLNMRVGRLRLCT